MQKEKPKAETPITRYAFTKSWKTPDGVTSDTFERLGLIRRDFEIDLRNEEMRYQFVLTEYAANFMEACRGPQRPSGSISPDL